MNLFYLRDISSLPNYVCSWSDDETNRIFSVSIDEDKDDFAFITAGREVKLWKALSAGQDLPEEDALIIRATVLPLSLRNVADSGSSSDSEPEAELDVQREQRNEEEKSGWGCGIL